MTKPPERLSLEDLPDMLTVPEAAKATRLNAESIRRAIRRGELEAIGRAGKRGKNLGNYGYRIHKATLEAWYFNLAKEAQS